MWKRYAIIAGLIILVALSVSCVSEKFLFPEEDQASHERPTLPKDSQESREKPTLQETAGKSVEAINDLQHMLTETITNFSLLDISGEGSASLRDAIFHLQAQESFSDDEDPLPISYDKDMEKHLQEVTIFEFNLLGNFTAEEVLDHILAQADLSFVIENDRIQIIRERNDDVESGNREANLAIDARLNSQKLDRQ